MSWQRRARGAKASRVGSAFQLPEPALPGLPTRILAIDPGTRHCGMAWFGYNPDGHWVLDETADRSPLDCILQTRQWMLEVIALNLVGNLVVEGYQLYPDKLQEQGMSRMGTPEVIGALKWLYLDECWMGWRSADRPIVRVEFVEPGASIKSHGRRYMAEQNIEETGSNQHKRDAEAHGYYRIKVLEAQRAKIKPEPGRD